VASIRVSEHLPAPGLIAKAAGIVLVATVPVGLAWLLIEGAGAQAPPSAPSSPSPSPSRP
jgi:hypothetical protein